MKKCARETRKKEAGKVLCVRARAVRGERQALVAGEQGLSDKWNPQTECAHSLLT